MAKNEAHKQPSLNLALGRAYLSAHDPRLCTRTWQAVMDEMATHGKPATHKRCKRAMRSRAFDPIREKPLVETTADDILPICHAHGNSVGHYLRRLHNLHGATRHRASFALSRAEDSPATKPTCHSISTSHC